MKLTVILLDYSDFLVFHQTNITLIIYLFDIRTLFQDMPVKLDVMARISDTTGALMAGNYADKKCRIGVILGIKSI